MTQAQTNYQAYPYQSFIPFYANGLRITNDATTPNTLLDVATGTILDSTGTFQLSLTSPVVINAAVVGLNGIDTGTLAASTVYNVYLIADPILLKPTGAMISLSYTQPYLPTGYGYFAKIGYIVTDSMSHFLPGFWSNGNTTDRLFMFDAPQATAVTAGNATSYTAVNLSALVPAVDYLRVWIQASFTSAAAGHTLSLQPFGGTGAPVVVTGQATAGVFTQNNLLFSRLNAGVPEINYKVANSSDAVAINVVGYEFGL